MGHKVSRNFKTYTEDKTVSFANTIYERMSSDNQFITLKPFVDDIKVKKDALVTGIALAVRKDQDRIDEKNIFKKDLVNLLDRVAHKLEDLVADNGNNPRIITDAGFEIRNTTKSEKEAITSLQIPVLSAQDIENKPGELLLKWKPVPNAINYAIRYKKKAETEWHSGFFNDKERFTFTNLESDNVYEFQVCTLGSNSLSSGYSASVTIYVS